MIIIYYMITSWYVLYRWILALCDSIHELSSSWTSCMSDRFWRLNGSFQHLMPKWSKNVCKLWRFWQFHWESTDQFWSMRHVQGIFVQIWRELYPFTHMYQNNVISLNEWEILTCCEPQTNCSDIWASCFEKCFSQLKIEPKWMRKTVIAR